MKIFFDIGGTNTRVAVSDGNLLLKDVSFLTSQDFASGVEILAKTIDELLEGKQPEIVIGGIAGRLNSEKTGVVVSPNLRGWEGKDLVSALIPKYPVKAILENDAALGALGEAVYGAGKGYGIVSFLTLGTGFGGARIVDGKIDRNFSGFEPGKQIVNIGNFETLEDLLSGKSLERKYQVKSAGEIQDKKIWEEAEKNLAIGINNAVLFWSPEIVVLSGALIERGAVDIENVKKYSAQIKKMPQIPKVVKGELGGKCGLFGAMVISRENL